MNTKINKELGLDFSGAICPDGYEKVGRFCEKVEVKSKFTGEKLDASGPLSDLQKQQIINLQMIRTSATVIGNIAGAALAYKRGSGFWGYVGFILLGGFVVGSIGYLATIPAQSKLALSLAKSQDEAKKSETKTEVKK